MTKETQVYRLLGRALLDIRIATHEGNNRVALDIADLFHNIPFKLERIREQGGDYREILDWLEMRAEQKMMGSWLQRAVRDSVGE